MSKKTLPEPHKRTRREWADHIKVCNPTLYADLVQLGQAFGSQVMQLDCECKDCCWPDGNRPSRVDGEFHSC